MMPPWVYQYARAEASVHVQLRCEAVGPLVGPERIMRIRGQIERIFRDRTGTLRCGQRIAFTVPVSNPFAEADQTPSGTIYHNPDRLCRARWLEGFFEWDGELHLIHSQITPILGPTGEPVCRPEDESFLCAGNV